MVPDFIILPVIIIWCDEGFGDAIVKKNGLITRLTEKKNETFIYWDMKWIRILFHNYPPQRIWIFQAMSILLSENKLGLISKTQNENCNIRTLSIANKYLWNASDIHILKVIWKCVGRTKNQVSQLWGKLCMNKPHCTPIPAQTHSIAT